MNSLVPFLIFGLLGAVSADTLRYAQYERTSPTVVATYDFQGSAGSVEVSNVPDDADWTRTAFCSDKGRDYLFLFKGGSDDKIYQCRNNNSGDDLRYYSSIDDGVVRLRDLPSDFDPSSFGAGYDTTTERLYFFGLSEDRENVYMAEYSEEGGDARFTQSFTVPILNVPEHLDWSQWGISWGGSIFMQVVGKDDLLYSATFEPGRTAFNFNPESRRQVIGQPAGFNTSNFMLGANGGDSTVRYYLRDNRVTDFLPDSVPLGNGWYWNSWLGAFYGESYPWFYRDGEEGWLFGQGDPDGLFYFANNTGGWFWTADDVSPWYRDLTSNTWRGDPEPPSIAGLNINSSSATMVELSWTAEDNFELASAELFRIENGNQQSLGSVLNQSSYSDTSVSAGSTVSYRLLVRDPEGNEAEENSNSVTLPQVENSEEE